MLVNVCKIHPLSSGALFTEALSLMDATNLHVFNSMSYEVDSIEMITGASFSPVIHTLA